MKILRRLWPLSNKQIKHDQDGTLGLRRRKGMAVKLEQLKVDKDGNIFKVEAGVLPEATHNLARKALNIAACVEDAYADTVKKALAKCNQQPRRERRGMLFS